MLQPGYTLVSDQANIGLLPLSSPSDSIQTKTTTDFIVKTILSERSDRRLEEGTILQKCEDNVTRRVLAVLKSVSIRFPIQQESPEQAVNEFAFHMTLRHPSLVRCLQAFREGDELKIVLEHCKYYDLTHYTGIFTASAATRIIAQLFSVVHYLHTLPYSSHLFVHGDIKLSNCFIDHNTDLKLGDFGTVHLQQQSRVDAETSSARNGLYGVTKGYLPYFRNAMPVVSQCTDIWAVFLVTVSVLINSDAFFQFTNPTSLSHYLQRYSLDLLHSLDGHDPRYKEAFAYLTTKDVIEAYYNLNPDTHDMVRAWFRSLLHRLPIMSCLSSTALFSFEPGLESPFLIREDTANAFTKLHNAYTQRALLTLAAAQPSDLVTQLPTEGGSSRVASRTVYFNDEISAAYFGLTASLIREEIEMLSIDRKILRWVLTLALHYTDSQECFWKAWPSMYAEILEVASTLRVESPDSALLLDQEDLSSIVLEDSNSFYFDMSKQLDIIELTLSNSGVQNPRYLWTLAIDYAIICPGSLDELMDSFVVETKIKAKI